MAEGKRVSREEGGKVEPLWVLPYTALAKMVVRRRAYVGDTMRTRLAEVGDRA